MKKIGTAVKKLIPVNVYEFEGMENIETLEGIVYCVYGETYYILEGGGGEKWPIAKIIFNDTYNFTIKEDKTEDKKGEKWQNKQKKY